MPIEEAMTPKQLKALLDAGADVFVLDVREPHETAICRIEGSHEIPLAQLPSRQDEVPWDKDVVVLCKMGGRSAQAVAYLQSCGHTRVRNLSGGILRWIDEVDASLARY